MDRGLLLLRRLSVEDDEFVKDAIFSRGVQESLQPSRQQMPHHLPKPS